MTVRTLRHGPTGKTASVTVLVMILVRTAATVAPGVLKCLTDLTISAVVVRGVVKVVVSFVFVFVVRSRPCLLSRTRFYPSIRLFTQEFTRIEGFLCFTERLSSSASILFVNPVSSR